MPKTPAPSLLDPADDLTQVLGPDLAKAFLDHRRALKAPMTQFAAQLMAKKLRTMPDPVASVEQSIIKGWKDCFPVEPLQKPQQFNRPTSGVAAEREKLRQEIENEQHSLGQKDQDTGPSGRLQLFDWQGADRPH